MGSGDGDTSKCDIPGTPESDLVFILDPKSPAECTGQTVSWKSDQYKEPPIIQGFIPGVGTFGLNRPNAARLGWEVNHQEGTQFVLLLRPEGWMKGGDAMTSPLITVSHWQGREVSGREFTLRYWEFHFTYSHSYCCYLASWDHRPARQYQVSPPVVRCTTPCSTMWPRRISIASKG